MVGAALFKASDQVHSPLVHGRIDRNCRPREKRRATLDAAAMIDPVWINVERQKDPAGTVGHHAVIVRLEGIDPDSHAAARNHPPTANHHLSNRTIEPYDHVDIAMGMGHEVSDDIPDRHSSEVAAIKNNRLPHIDALWLLSL
ncbi:MAG TPA: hypothetical protein VGH40_01245 [Roseiarcus sp.]